MALSFRRACDVESTDLYFKILLFGDSGAGKTWLASSAPCPVILLTERNGEQSVRLSNPEARYVIVGTAPEVRDFLVMARDGSLHDALDIAEGAPVTLVLDGLTEIQQLIKDEMTEGRGDGEFSIRDWGTLNEKMRRLMRMLRDLPYNVVCTALSETETAEEVRYVKPAFQGRKLAGEVMQYFNLVGYVHKSKKRGARDGAGVEHLAMFDGPARITCKSCSPIYGSRPGPMAGWFTELACAGQAPEETATETDSKPAEEPEPEPEPEPEKPKTRARPRRRRQAT